MAPILSHVEKRLESFTQMHVRPAYLSRDRKPIAKNPYFTEVFRL
jgi:hypothetical protein